MYSSLYIHVPFCHGKCAYCAFYSLPSASPAQRRAYLERLKAEFSAYSDQCRPLRSIFIGGGTPSLLSIDEWEELFSAIHGGFPFEEGCEWSCEANPDSLSSELLDCWRKNGVNRVSIGIQSFHENLRRTIGRCGKLAALPPEIKHFALNLDLIFNIPGETTAEWEEDLRQALLLRPDHLSCYALTLEEGTRLARALPPLSDEQFPAMWDASDRILGASGIHRYEISNFAREGRKCRHNLEIWRGGSYLGCGPAASSFDGVERRTNPPSLEKWLRNEPPERDPLPPERRAAEILATGFRLLDGWDRRDFLRRTGFDAWRIRGPQMRRLQRLSLLELTDDHAAPTAKGLLFNDNIAMELL